MKRKLLFAALCVVSALGLRAQTDVTSTYLTNPSFELGSNGTAASLNYSADNLKNEANSTIYGWTKSFSLATIDGNWQWQNLQVYKSTDSNASGYGSSVAPSDGDYYYFWRQGWTSNTNTLTTISKNQLEAGSYTFSVDYKGAAESGKASNITLKVFDGENEIVSTTSANFPSKNRNDNTDKTYFNTVDWTSLSTQFVITSPKNVTFQIIQALNGSSARADVCLDNVKLTCSPFAAASDYAALNEAISAVESKTWGFDAGEYAPYNYAEVIRALAEAKAINQEANNSQATVQALTATLNTTMTANAVEVNAIWDPSFEHEYSTSGNVQPIAWTGTSGHNNATDVRWMWNVSSNAGLAATSSSKALFTKFGVHYGQQAGYTLPLNASTYYTLSFKYGGWSDCKKDGYVTMTDPASASLSILASNRLPLDAVDGNSNTASWKNYSAFFKTNDAGNYILGLRKDNESQQSQYVYGDFMLKATTKEEATAYYNAVKDEVDDSYNAEANGGSEKTAFKAALEASVPATVSEIMEAAANFYTLRDAFVAATPKYDLYVAEKANAERIDASITSAISAPTTAAEAENAWHTILVNEYNYVKDNFNADAAEAYGITIDKWTGTATSGDSADTPQTNSGEKWGETATTYYEQGKNGWGSTAWTLNYTKTVTLPANTYVLKVAARASQGTTATLKATIGGTTYTEALPNFSAEGKGITTSGVASFSDGEFAKDGKGYGWQWRYLAFTLDAEGEVTLQIDASANSVNQWCSFGDVAVVSNVTTDDLETAYNNFVMPTLGFEDGQYAPYNNVEVLSAYAEAKAIVEGTKEPSTQPAVDALTATLTSPSWTVNVGAVDIIYNGDFAKANGNNPEGWTRSNNAWGQQQTGLDPETNGTSGTTAWYYNTNGAWEYGKDDVYKMPLLANQLYKLTFKYRSHAAGSNNWMKASVLNESEQGLSVVQFPQHADATVFVPCVAYFRTGDAGNYILSLEQNGNTHMTDVSLVKAEASELALGAMPTNYTYYQNVSLDRTFSTANYSTLVLPFAMTADETTDAFAEAYTLTGVEGESLKFSAATEIAAGTPYLVKAKNATLSVSDKAIDPATPVTNKVVKSTDEQTTATFVGTFAGVNLTSAANSNAWVVSNDKLYKVDSNVTVGAYRGYFTVETAGGVKALNLDLEGADGIGALRNAENVTMGNAIFNLAGQRINKLQKGVNIINGKKVLVK